MYHHNQCSSLLRLHMFHMDWRKVSTLFRHRRSLAGILFRIYCWKALGSYYFDHNQYSTLRCHSSPRKASHNFNMYVVSLSRNSPLNTTWGKYQYQKDCMGTHLSILSSVLCLHLYRHHTFRHMVYIYEKHRCRGHIRVGTMFHNGLGIHWYHLLGYDISIQTSLLSNNYYSRCGRWQGMCDTDNHTIVLAQVYPTAGSRFDIANWCLCRCKLGIRGPQLCYREGLSHLLKSRLYFRTKWLNLRKSWWSWSPWCPDQFRICLPS